MKIKISQCIVVLKYHWTVKVNSKISEQKCLPPKYLPSKCLLPKYLILSEKKKFSSLQPTGYHKRRHAKWLTEFMPSKPMLLGKPSPMFHLSKRKMFRKKYLLICQIVFPGEVCLQKLVPVCIACSSYSSWHVPIWSGPLEGGTLSRVNVSLHVVEVKVVSNVTRMITERIGSILISSPLFSEPGVTVFRIIG